MMYSEHAVRIKNIKQSGMKSSSLGKDEYYYWGMCLSIMEEYEQALLKFEQVLKFDNQHENSLWQIVSILFYDQQSAVMAKSILESRLLKINPNHPTYLEALTDIKSYLSHLPKSEGGTK